LLGTALIASGTSALNQWYEHQSDALMRRRTEKRPIPAGAITPRNALLFGFVLSCVGYFQLSVWAATG
jgi:protoheme IX farnesyltransferase